MANARAAAARAASKTDNFDYALESALNSFNAELGTYSGKTEDEIKAEKAAEAEKSEAWIKENKGKVIDCTQKGYKLGDKVIRFAKVVVGE